MTSKRLTCLTVGLTLAALLWSGAAAEACIDQRSREKGQQGAGLRQVGCLKAERPILPGGMVGKPCANHVRNQPARRPVACNQRHGQPGGFGKGMHQVCQQGGRGGPGRQVGQEPRRHGPRKEARACGQEQRPQNGGFHQGMKQVGCAHKDKGRGKPANQPGQCVGKGKKGPPQVAQGPRPHGNNGVGNGFDPQPPGNPPINDGRGAFPGNPGNRGGPKKGAGFAGFAAGGKGKKPKK